jgi:hypothetical protein
MTQGWVLDYISKGMQKAMFHEEVVWKDCLFHSFNKHHLNIIQLGETMVNTGESMKHDSFPVYEKLG